MFGRDVTCTRCKNVFRYDEGCIENEKKNGIHVTSRYKHNNNMQVNVLYETDNNYYYFGKLLW